MEECALLCVLIGWTPDPGVGPPAPLLLGEKREPNKSKECYLIFKIIMNAA